MLRAEQLEGMAILALDIDCKVVTDYAIRDVVTLIGRAFHVGHEMQAQVIQALKTRFAHIMM